MTEYELNWIGGRWVEAASGYDFEPEVSADLDDEEGVPIAFPRSGSADLARAVEVAGEAATGWHARTSAERFGVLMGMLEELAGVRGRDGDCIGPVLDLSPRATTHERRTARRAGERILFEEGPPAERPGLALARARAGEAFVGPLARALPALADGLAVVLLSDPDVPWFALEVARAAARAGLPAGVLGLLHDDGETVLRAGLAHPGLARYHLSGSRPELARFRREVARRAAQPARAAASAMLGGGGRAVPFGAGVLEAPPVVLELELVRNASRVVREHESVDSAAESVARAAFGRVEAFSGQRAGQVGRVFCHELLFSDFTDCLLEAIEEQVERERELPILDPELTAAVERRVRLGLDEGATLILGTPLGLADSRRSRRNATLSPTVFTNAEPRMRLVRAARPAPVLCLLRIAGDEEGEALADAIDELSDGPETATGNGDSGAPEADEPLDSQGDS